MSESNEGEQITLHFVEYHKGGYLITMGKTRLPRWNDLDCVGRLVPAYTKESKVKWWLFHSKENMVYDQVMHDAIGNKLRELNKQEREKA